MKTLYRWNAAREARLKRRLDKASKMVKKMLGKQEMNNIPGIISKSVIARFLPKKPVIIEAGAHIGLDTVELAKTFPGGRIYAFEPVPKLYGQLVERTRKYKNISCSPLALSTHNGTISMYISSGTSISSSSVLPPKEHRQYHPGVLFEEQIIVPCVTLDNWAKENGVTRIDFLWLDLQGYELHVLKSAEDVLKDVTAVYTEVNLKELYTGAPLYVELRAWLEAKGFRIEREELPWEDAGNVLFVR